MKKTTFMWLACVLWISIGKAQGGDALPKDTLRTATIVDQRIVNMEQLRLHHIDSLDKQMHGASNLGELLQQAGAINLKVYGAGGISSISVRGGQSSQTAVLWNGINLQDPLNGGVNFSLIPAFFVDEVDIHAGGYSALFGSGAMSGSIHTSSKLRFEDGMRFGLSQIVGSFGERQTGLDIRVSKKRFLNTTKLFYRVADNDFTFINTQKFATPLDTQRNANECEVGIMQENAILLGKKMRLSSHLWWTSNVHQVPQNMTVVNAKQSQEDQSFKALLAWKKLGTWKWNIRSAAFYSYLKYLNPDANMIAEHRSFVNSNEMEVSRKWKINMEMEMGLAHRYTKGISEQLTLSNPELHTLAGFVSLKWNYKNLWKLGGNLRQEARGSVIKQPSYSLHLSSGLWNGLRIWTSLSRNYRMPTFNDLYWLDGYSKGNPDLLDEFGISQDVNLSYEKRYKNISLFLLTSIYHQDIQNMIQWLPVEGIWTPVNHQRVKSRGVEARAQMQYCVNQFMLSLKTNYQYTQSVLEEVSGNNAGGTIGNQLIYTPKHQASGRIVLMYRKYKLGVEESFIGSRFTTADNKALMMLDPVWLLHAQAGREFHFKKHRFQLNLQVNNALNHSYQLIRLYPMPGRYYSLEIKYLLTHKK